MIRLSAVALRAITIVSAVDELKSNTRSEAPAPSKATTAMIVTPLILPPFPSLKRSVSGPSPPSVKYWLLARWNSTYQ